MLDLFAYHTVARLTNQVGCQEDHLQGVGGLPFFCNFMTTDWTSHQILFIQQACQNLRRRFPKTSVPCPAPGSPCHFQSVFSTFSWADLWIQCASQRFGRSWVLSRLKKWRWNMTTAFSGCGAVESASSMQCHAVSMVISKIHCLANQC